MVAGSEGAGTMTFVENLIDEVAGDKARQKPSIMHIDNMGAVHIANNQAVTPRTKHVDIRVRYLQQKVRDGSMECKHIPNDKFHADIETKALPEQTYIAHEDAIHNGVFSFVESTEVVVPAGKEDVKLSQVARECRQTRPQVPRDQSNDSDLMKKVRFADEFEWKTVKSKRESKLDRLAKG